MHWGTLVKSLFSLYMAVTGGNDWARYYYALNSPPGQYRRLLWLYLTVVAFAVWDVFTGMFVDSAMQNHKASSEDVINEEPCLKAQRGFEMQRFFEEMVYDGSGQIILVEFEGELEGERLGVSDARMPVSPLDYGRSDTSCIEEFISGCYNPQREPRGMDMTLMQYELRGVRVRHDAILEHLNAVLMSLGQQPVRRRPGLSIWMSASAHAKRPAMKGAGGQGVVSPRSRQSICVG